MQIDLFNYTRRTTTTAQAGSVGIGGENPIRLQSMTTTDTNDTQACVEQALKIIDAGGELVRLTTQGKREAENLKNINAALRSKGVMTPLVADVHFNANVADVAALYAEKVRINPGNYVDPARTFKQIDYTDEEYAQELQKIEDRLVPFIQICKTNHTAVRIGVNHGSLSDRIRCRYGDTPEGIVESCMEFLRIFRKYDFSDVVISIKSSNTVVMVRSVRLLVETMAKEDMHYPLHLGVTEAGEGEDGRIKSAVGIGALLCDGIGDTIRVSLSEAPEAEILVAKHLVDYILQREGHMMIPATAAPDFCWTKPQRRKTKSVGVVGGENVPVVVGNSVGTHAPDFVYVGQKIPDEIDKNVRYVIDYDVYARKIQSTPLQQNFFPIYPTAAMPFIGRSDAPLKFLVLQYGADSEEYVACLKQHPEVVVVCATTYQNRLGSQRALAHDLMRNNLENPIIFAQQYRHSSAEKSDFQIESAADMGSLMIDGLCDGIWLMNDGDLSADEINQTAFAILQAARLRMSKTEYISCPGCGRTLYNLQETIARIKKSTQHLTGLKIGIMGCIVNGPGEMADADYGYVGAGPHKVSLYRRQVCVEKNIPEEEAVEHLLRLIESDQQQMKNEQKNV